MHQAAAADASAVWGRAREELQATLPPSSFKLWVEPVRAISSDGTTLYLSAPEGVRTWIERRYAPRIVAALQRHAPSLSDVDFVSGPEAIAAQDAVDPEPGPRGGDFADFVIGASNRFAHAAALAVAELPAEAYNPLFLHGPPGVGKTHLLGAIADYLRRSRPSMPVVYTTGERFTAEFVGALRAGDAEGFKRRYRKLGVLLLDDVQFVEDKARTAEELFHTFDALRSEGGQIVLSSDRPPKELSRLAERLRDRFEWGLCAEIRPPDVKTRQVAVGRLAQRAFPVLAEPGRAPLLREVADRCSNLRRAEGALTRVAALSSLLGSAPSLAVVRDALERQAPDSPARPAPSVEQIQDAVCSVLHLSRDELLSNRRTPAVVRARQLAIYLARERLSLSLGDLARAFNRDRATVLYSLRSVERDIGPDTPTSAALARAAEHLDAERPGGELPPER